jgi:hypothetical protein
MIAAKSSLATSEERARRDSSGLLIPHFNPLEALPIANLVVLSDSRISNPTLA